MVYNEQPTVENGKLVPAAAAAAAAGDHRTGLLSAHLWRLLRFGEENMLGNRDSV